MVPAPAKSLKKFVAFSDCGSSARCIYSKKHAPGFCIFRASEISQRYQLNVSGQPVPVSRNSIIGPNYIYRSSIDLFCDQLTIWFIATELDCDTRLEERN